MVPQRVLAEDQGAFWHRRGYWGEGRDWLAAALGKDLERCLELGPWRAKALHQAGVLTFEAYDLFPSISMLEESLAL